MRNKIYSFLCSYFVAGLFSLTAQTVTTEYGQLQGTINGAVYQFLGIPFAKPPVGNLRWKAPQNPDAWAGILTTTSFAPICPQKKYETGGATFTLEGNEDCLYLNVWTPQTGAGNRPVMVFIHGGGNQQGGATETGGGAQMFFGKNLSERGDVVVVTIQYRLGPLGYLVHPGLEPENTNGVSGNYAVLDQILALKWIKNNISAFGGDPTRVMIFGESAGGVNVGNLMMTPLAAGLFQRAGIQSAVPNISDYTVAKNKGIAYVDTFIKAGTDIQKIAQMRLLTSDSLVAVLPSPLEGGVVQMNWQPVKDNVVFANFPAATFQSGVFNKVPLLIGTNSEEMSLSAPQTVTPGMVNALVIKSLPAELRDQALAFYPAGTNNEDARKSYVGILTDAQFTSNARRTAQCVSLNQMQPVWRYFFTHKHTVAALETLGSYHGMELFYVFNTWENATLGSGIFFKPQDDSVQKAMLKYWTNFAATGNPNGAGLVNWPQFQSTTDPYLEIKATPVGTRQGLRTLPCDLWDAGIGYVKCTSSLGLEENTSNSKLLVYPNPGNGIFTVNPINPEENFCITIYDFTGKRILESENVRQVDLSGFPSAMYFISLSQNGKVWKERIVLH